MRSLSFRPGYYHREIGTTNMQISAVVTTLLIAAKDGQRSASDLSKIADVSMSKIGRQIPATTQPFAGRPVFQSSASSGALSVNDVLAYLMASTT
jgi:hypothetical protein